LLTRLLPAQLIGGNYLLGEPDGCIVRRLQEAGSCPELVADGQPQEEEYGPGRQWVRAAGNRVSGCRPIQNQHYA
jgi:hypothetical protein